MKTGNVLIATITLSLSAAGYALQSHNDTDEYQIVAIKDCQMVYVDTPSPSVLDAYEALKDDEDSMRVLEAPIKDLEEQIKVFTDQIEALSEEAIDENEDRLIINKQKLAEHSALAEELDDYIANHQASFDALETIGDLIAQKAHRFEEAVNQQLDGIDYDQLHFVEPGESLLKNKCYTKSRETRHM